MHRAQNQRFARNITVHHYQKQEEYTRKVGVEEVQSYHEENDRSQRNQIKIIQYGKESCCFAAIEQ
jgi:hypothetical protein